MALDASKLNVKNAAVKRLLQARTRRCVARASARQRRSRAHDERVCAAWRAAAAQSGRIAA
jgi:hypothetical protein